jgi:hypothetical protein
MKRLIIAAVGLALVVGMVVGAIVGNLFGASAQRTSAAAVTGSGCYTNWNSADCTPGWTAVSTGVWTLVGSAEMNQLTALICAQAKPEDSIFGEFYPYSDSTNFRVHDEALGHVIDHEPCAICCASGSFAVGGIAELPALAGAPGTGASGMGGATYAVLAGAAAGVLAFAVLAALSVKRRAR